MPPVSADGPAGDSGLAGGVPAPAVRLISARRASRRERAPASRLRLALALRTPTNRPFSDLPCHEVPSGAGSQTQTVAPATADARGGLR